VRGPKVKKTECQKILGLKNSAILLTLWQSDLSAVAQAGKPIVAVKRVTSVERWGLQEDHWKGTQPPDLELEFGCQQNLIQ